MWCEVDFTTKHARVNETQGECFGPHFLSPPSGRRCCNAFRRRKLRRRKLPRRQKRRRRRSRRALGSAVTLVPSHESTLWEQSLLFARSSKAAKVVGRRVQEKTPGRRQEALQLSQLRPRAARWRRRCKAELGTGKAEFWGLRHMVSIGFAGVWRCWDFGVLGFWGFRGFGALRFWDFEVLGF